MLDAIMTPACTGDLGAPQHTLDNDDDFEIDLTCIGPLHGSGGRNSVRRNQRVGQPDMPAGSMPHTSHAVAVDSQVLCPAHPPHLVPFPQEKKYIDLPVHTAHSHQGVPFVCTGRCSGCRGSIGWRDGPGGLDAGPTTSRRQSSEEPVLDAHVAELVRVPLHQFAPFWRAGDRCVRANCVQHPDPRAAVGHCPDAV